MDILDSTPIYGKLYYDTGELRYEGYYRKVGATVHDPYGNGIMYYKDGTVYRDGIFNGQGLQQEGKEYYPSGKLHFEGKFDTIANYFEFPAYGSFYLEDGTLSYEGEFKIQKDSKGYLRVVKPENYGRPNLGRIHVDNPAIEYGKLYYDTGEIHYEGYYKAFEHDATCHKPWGRGIMYYKDGSIKKEGIFGLGGLLEGRLYYPSGKLKFEGKFNNKAGKGGSYYGPTYPISGKFYLENGSLAYSGGFKVVRQGNVGYPKVVKPANFGSLD